MLSTALGDYIASSEEDNPDSHFCGAYEYDIEEWNRQG